MFFKAEVLSPKETLHGFFWSFSYLWEPPCPCPPAPAPGACYWKLYLKIKRPLLDTDEEKSFYRDGLICFTELNFSVTAL